MENFVCPVIKNGESAILASFCSSGPDQFGFREMVQFVEELMVSFKLSWIVAADRHSLSQITSLFCFGLSTTGICQSDHELVQNCLNPNKKTSQELKTKLLPKQYLRQVYNNNNKMFSPLFTCRLIS